jgi:DNA-binding NtrC family response regulator
MNGKGRILIVDDELQICTILHDALEIAGFSPSYTTQSVEVIHRIKTERPDLVLLDLNMPGLDGLQILQNITAQGISVPVIMMTGFSSMETAVKAIRMGAKDYLTKPLNFNNLDNILTKWIEEYVKVTKDSQKSAQSIASHRIGMIGSSPGMVEVYKNIGAVSKTPNNTTILILGESGTGKEMVARQIHDFGDQAAAPYLALNMTALPDTLIESELFGYEKGAFTGATQQKAGQFELAGEGTLFLDEIGSISPGVQQKLLRVLQEREFRRVGGSRTLPIHCRIVAATNSDLNALTQSGEFRADLFHRLKGVAIRIPPLRERREDIPRLAEYFIHFNARELNRKPPTMDHQTIDLLMKYEWPGNVRELKNAIASAIILNRSDFLRIDDFHELSGFDAKSDESPLPEELASARAVVIEQFERRYLADLLRRFRGNVIPAAEVARITPQRFYQMLKKYGMRGDEYK